IIERGTHSSLYAQGGRYYDLYTKQHGVETNLFLAPGEGDKAEADESAGNGNGRPTNGGSGGGSALSETINLIRQRKP
ncbi:MAG: hypothetical protein ACRD40_18990, partial [Candidatus Acidiferrales bacterium]